jgi:hypothetical protein
VTTERESRLDPLRGSPTQVQQAEVPGADGPLAAAARGVLAADGRGFALQPWQIAYCFALAEGRAGVVPPGCGVGKGWLDARLREAMTDTLT